jgi:hypothetical protein
MTTADKSKKRHRLYCSLYLIEVNGSTRIRWTADVEGIEKLRNVNKIAAKNFNGKENVGDLDIDGRISY